MKKSAGQWLSQPARLLALVLATLAWTGCGNQLPTEPAASSTSVTFKDPKIASNRGGARSVMMGDAGWQVVAKEWVVPGRKSEVSGSRYRLEFDKRAVTDSVPVTISEYDSNICEFELGPHGTQFNTLVHVVVDYKGTNLDPDSPNYTGGSPVFLYLNPETLAWEIVPGFKNSVDKNMHAWLEHFSRYAVSEENAGTCEW